MRILNANGFSLIRSFEGFSETPYKDQVGRWTIGYGTTFYSGGRAVTKDDESLTRDQASDILEDLLNSEYCPEVERAVEVSISDNQFAALVSFTYNEGIGNLLQSTVLKCTNMKNWNDAALAFMLWTKIRVNGELVQNLGLTRRRKAEQLLYLTP